MLAALLPWLRRPFTLDLRALALLRIGVGAILLVDLGIRATDLEAFYANLGVLPLAALHEYLWTPYQFSLHAASGLWQVQPLLFLVAAGAALALLLGYRTPPGHAGLLGFAGVAAQPQPPYQPRRRRPAAHAA